LDLENISESIHFKEKATDTFITFMDRSSFGQLNNKEFENHKFKFTNVKFTPTTFKGEINFEKPIYDYTKAEYHLILREFDNLINNLIN